MYIDHIHDDLNVPQPERLIRSRARALFSALGKREHSDEVRASCLVEAKEIIDRLGPGREIARLTFVDSGEQELVNHFEARHGDLAFSWSQEGVRNFVTSLAGLKGRRATVACYVMRRLEESGSLDFRAPKPADLFGLDFRHDSSEWIRWALLEGGEIVALEVIRQVNPSPREIATLFIEGGMKALRPGTARQWSDLLKRAGFSDSAYIGFIDDLVLARDSRSLIALALLGFDLSSIQPVEGPLGNMEFHRLAQRASSSHGRLSLFKQVGSMEDLATLPEPAMRSVLRG